MGKKQTLLLSNTSLRGFTIVELLIVIVVIGILAAITIVSYNGVQKRATNTTKLSEINAWKDIFESYKATNGSYPAMTNAGYCLGKGFPNGKCRDYQSTSTYYNESDNAALMTELNKLAATPRGIRTPINGTVGPYIMNYNNGTFDLIQVFSGTASECPAPLQYSWDDGAGRLLCGYRITN